MTEESIKLAQQRYCADFYYQWAFDKFLNTSVVDFPNLAWFKRSILRGFEELVDRPTIIGLCGNAGVGKDSATDLFMHKDLNCVKMAFADPIREIGKIFGFTMEQMTDRTLKEQNDEFWKFSPRYFMQRVGTEMFRKHLREDVWIELMHKRLLDIRKLPKDKVPNLIFITDVRFENEAEYIRSQGGIIVKIQRANFSKSGANLHDSERFVSMIKADKVIINDSPNSNVWTWEFTKTLINYLMTMLEAKGLPHHLVFSGLKDKGVQEEMYTYYLPEQSAK